MNKQKGLSLIELIVSMWITGLVIFSTLICTTDLQVKIDQHRIEALTISKSELDKLRYWAYKGLLTLSPDPIHNPTAGTRIYTKIIWVTDRKMAPYDSISNTVTYTPSQFPGKLFDSLDEKPNKIDDIPDIPFDKGHFIQTYLELEKNNAISNPKINLIRGTGIGETEAEASMPYIMDVSVKETHKPYQIQGKYYSQESTGYLYEIELRTAWFEKQKNKMIMKTESYTSRVYSAIVPTFR